jgi:hypothetical protein
MAVANTPAYCDTEIIMAVKMVYRTGDSPSKEAYSHKMFK